MTPNIIRSIQVISGIARTARRAEQLERAVRQLAR